jgi:biotin carboxyl carrier protein
MEHSLKIQDTIYQVDVASPDSTGSITTVLDGNTRKIVAQPISHNRLSVAIDGQRVTFFAVRADEGTWIWVDGHARLVQDADMMERRQIRGRSELPREVTPPTPAAVIRVLVATGQQVVRGEGLVVVSAMKMEITLSAPYSGVVRAINVTPGDQVKPGDILVEIEASSEENPK